MAVTLSGTNLLAAAGVTDPAEQARLGNLCPGGNCPGRPLGARCSRRHLKRGGDPHDRMAYRATERIGSDGNGGRSLDRLRAFDAFRLAA